MHLSLLLEARVPHPGELTQPVVRGVNAMVSERGVERIAQLFKKPPSHQIIPARSDLLVRNYYVAVERIPMGKSIFPMAS